MQVSSLVTRLVAVTVAFGVAACSGSRPDAPDADDGAVELDDTGVGVAGKAAPAKRQWNSVAISVSSPSPYTNLFRQSWVIDAPAGATAMRVHFTTLRTEKDYDFVNVYGAGSALMASYDGRQDGTTSPAVPGNRVTVELVTDRSITAAGFAIDRFDWQ